ncbi:hypothetical protein Kuja_0730 [Vibrio phage vB_VchM_Kuja]|uniref:Uncharacterized protein n=1 Tax=Vibrio phage vB_VchM_Kuja TaxID=2686437 RepID=A0A6B9J7Q5_9CAUD|nr:hypothetical protein HWC83_gp163 [Vibrio phage vB_VchM_Kuja]QGZ16064.1 hypothetical protein Kuja_0730 [Vibrio phage vB_VchM_Kuja]
MTKSVIRVSIDANNFLMAELAGSDSSSNKYTLERINNDLYLTTPFVMSPFTKLDGLIALDVLENCLAYIYPKDLTEVIGYNEKCERVNFAIRGPHCPYVEMLALNPDIMTQNYIQTIIDLLDNRRFFFDQKTGFPTLNSTGLSMAEARKIKANELSIEKTPQPDETQEPTQQKSNKVFLRYVMSCCGTEVRMEEFDVCTDHPSGPKHSSEYSFSVVGTTVYLYAVIAVTLDEYVTCDEFMEKLYNSRKWRKNLIDMTQGTPIQNAFFGSGVRGSFGEAGKILNCFGDFIVEGKKNPEEPQEQSGDLFVKIIGGVEGTLKDVGNIINQVKQSSQLSQAKAMIKTLLHGIKKGEVDVVDVGVDVRGKKYALRMNDQLGASDWLTLHKAKIFMGGKVDVGRYIVPTAMMEQFKEALGE